MKKRFLILLFGVLICVALIVYTHKSNTKTVPIEPDASTPVAPVSWTRFYEENWSLSLPEESWQELDNSVPEIKLAVQNTEKESLVLFSKEDTIDTFASYVANTLRVFVENDAKIYSASQVVINNNKFVLVQMTRKHEIIWFWLTVKDGYGYNLACASEYDPDAGLTTSRDFCQLIANTVQIN